MICVASKMVNWISMLTSAPSTLPKACHLLITNNVHDHPFVPFIAFTMKPTGSLNGWLPLDYPKTSLCWICFTLHHMSVLAQLAFYGQGCAPLLQVGSNLLNIQLYLNSTVPISYCPHVTAAKFSGLKQPDIGPFISKYIYITPHWCNKDSGDPLVFLPKLYTIWA